jgi:superfamily II DNA or RNA helicase
MLQSDTIYVGMRNHTHLVIDAEQSILYELQDHFCFWAKSYRHTPKFKAGIWDGKIRLFSPAKRVLLAGLFEALVEFAAVKGRNYHIEVMDNDVYGTPGGRRMIDPKELYDFIVDLDLHDETGKAITIHDYQFAAIYEGLSARRKVLLSPTASGKSLIMYVIVRWWLEHDYKTDDKFVIIVPTTALTKQLVGDFAEYSQTKEDWVATDYCQEIFAGQDKHTDHPILVSTWQSLKNYKGSFYPRVKGVIGDEAHQYAAETVQGIMKQCTDAELRLGTTGTLDGKKISEMVLEGTFGPRMVVTTSKEQMDKGRMSKLHINVLKMKYLEAERRGFKMTYADESAFIESHYGRMQFLLKVVMSLEGNTIILVRHRAHGQAIYEALQELTERPLFYIDGKVKAGDRDRYRKELNAMYGGIMVATYETTSTGTNVRNLHNLVFGSPYKAQIKVLQSLGRLLRLAADGSKAQLYDLVDDIQWKKHKNHLLRHGLERLGIYGREEFDYTVYDINLELEYDKAV